MKKSDRRNELSSSNTGSVAVFPGWLNNTTSSIGNNTGKSATWFQEFNFKGWSWYLKNGDFAQLGGWIFNDSFSSIAIG